MEEINDANIEKNTQNGNVYLQFSASWCNPCKVMKQRVDSISNKYSDINFFYVDIQTCDPSTLKKFNIKSIPHTFFIKNGVTKEEKIGMLKIDQLEDKLNNIFK
tara:strand:- start:2999 stop:3310 length:312 start_codon:yes stop_codon:yes gene_type:complete